MEEEWVVDDDMFNQAPSAGKRTLPSSSGQCTLRVWRLPAGQYTLPHDHSDLPVTDFLEERIKLDFSWNHIPISVLSLLYPTLHLEHSYHVLIEKKKKSVFSSCF